MFRFILKSKLQRLRVTDANLRYEGSLGLDEALMEAARLLPYEQVTVLNVNNGERLETYVIPEPRDSGTVCLNGPAARKGVVGDELIVLSYVLLAEEETAHHAPVIVSVDARNRLLQRAVL
ncbi:MAG: aspartate 1-decarboxylase [Candidatus Kapabacteria bacterium]|nr:aspartate 1-decarboxylase [Candidatus Kapabacteria bacterium]MDW7996089.1 aspartate 1-decarboxylase [Bacteroidota bacterium]MDW8224995.1 aspartate 1-decarboxylase [Bacteroidota bacterium]